MLWRISHASWLCFDGGSDGFDGDVAGFVCDNGGGRCMKVERLRVVEWAAACLCVLGFCWR